MSELTCNALSNYEARMRVDLITTNNVPTLPVIRRRESSPGLIPEVAPLWYLLALSIVLLTFSFFVTGAAYTLLLLMGLGLLVTSGGTLVATLLYLEVRRRS
jgi:hypothetical protein